MISLRMCSKSRAWSRAITQLHSSNASNLWLSRVCFSTPASNKSPNVLVPMSELRCEEIPRSKSSEENFHEELWGWWSKCQQSEHQAEIRFNVHQADWIPERLKEQFVNSNTGLIKYTGECIVSSQLTRSQTENLDDCFAKLKAILDECSKDLIDSLRMPTDEDEKILKEKALKAAAMRRLQKEAFSNKKQSRQKDPFMNVVDQLSPDLMTSKEQTDHLVNGINGHSTSPHKAAGKRHKPAMVSRGSKLIVMLAMTFLFFVVEMVCGYVSHSMALIADSFHMLSDVMAWLKEILNRTLLVGSEPKYLGTDKWSFSVGTVLYNLH
uniref:Cation efflux protein transmembrane domain-containing protein n=1 Tax=Ditylenchus dipsaci TaxID=166011 RepID=A0A915DPB7_9BILA